MKMKNDEGEILMETAINSLFWGERLFLCVLVVFSMTYAVSAATFALILTTTLVSLPYFLFCPNLYSVGPSGIGGIWLFLLDRSTFYFCFEYAKLLAQGIEITFLWRLAVLLSLVIHSIYIVDFFLSSPQDVPPLHDETSISTEEIDDDKEVGIKEVEEMKELVKELCNDVKEMKTDMNYSDILESLREEWGLFREESSKYGEKMMGRLDAMEHLIRLQLRTLSVDDNNCEKFQEELSSKMEKKASTQDFNKDAKSIIDRLHETYRVFQETAKEVKTKSAEDIKASKENFKKDVKFLADQLRETFVVIERTTEEAKKANLIYQEDQSKRQMIRGEDVEGFSELREEVWRLSMKAEELKRTTVELVDASFQQWEEDNADYIASLSLLYCNHN